MLESIKRLKLIYRIYNFFHRKELKYNEILFQKLGMNKKYYSSISSKDFKELKISLIREPAPDNPALKACSMFRRLPNPDQESLCAFSENGYAVIRQYLPDGEVNAINDEIESLLRTKKVRFNRKRKIMFAIRSSRLLYDIADNPELKEILSALLDGPAVLFQSINFLQGSEQATHSDSIHMTTHPPGGLLGVWIALEDITPENGPLHYFPGSHKLPYYLNADYDNEGNSFLLGDKSYAAYEDMIRNKIEKQGLKKTIFLAKKGDLLIWHANLFHGGEPHLNRERTRKSMVLHYFREGVICYHEITQRPALLKFNR
jgi:ectoine hydroxylase-related dioxygenase (phytanoyl-CoA dioxygenase family)